MIAARDVAIPLGGWVYCAAGVKAPFLPGGKPENH